MIITATVRARAHTDNPSRLGHLVVNLSQGGSHLVRQGTRNDHDIGLTGGSTENNTETILVVSGCRDVHHLNGAARETESDGPERTLTGPVCDLI